MSVAANFPISSQINPEGQTLRAVDRMRLQAQIPLATIAFSAVSSIYFFVLAISQGSWQLYILTGVFAIASILNAFSITRLITKNISTQMMVMFGVFQFAVLMISVLISGMAISGAAIILLYSLIVSSSTLPGEKTELGVSFGLLLSSVAAILGTISPIRQISLPQIYTVIPTILTILIMTYLSLVLMQVIVATLRIKLMSSTLAVVLIPLVLLALISSRFTQDALHSQMNQSLNLAAQQTAGKLDEFLQKTKNTVAYQAELPAFNNFLRMNPEERTGSLIKEQLDLTIGTLQFERRTYLTSIAIIDLNGENVYDTSRLAVGKIEKDADYFAITSSTEKPYVSPIKFSQDSGGGYIYFAAPIRNSQQQLMGVLRISYDALVFQSIVEENSGAIGTRSYPILIDENQLRIADSFTPALLYQTVSPLPYDSIATLRAQNRLPYKPNSELTTDLSDLANSIKRFQSNRYFSLDIHPNSSESHVEAGAITTLQNQPWKLIFVQEEAGLNRTISQQNRVSTLVAALIASMVGIFATFMARGFSGPIQNLTDTATKVTQGDMTARAVIETNDEIGILAGAFNSMTSQLSTLINELEDRVRARTQELASQNKALMYRSRQLQTVADVARGIAGAQDLETLLTQITNLISERFNFYHVGVFLVDEKNEFAVLRAANSEGGKKMLARQHKLRIGKVGIVGHVTSTGEPRIATDVGDDAVFFNNPDLPMTRSELALPLTVSGQIIGALDVQSTESSVFTNEDIALFNTLADQVAIAIENNRLFSKTAIALEEAQNTHRQYLRQEWGHELAERQHSGFVFTPQGVVARDPEENAEVLIDGDSKLVISKSEGDNRLTAAVPIQVRGETVGIIRVQDSGTEREWTEEELDTIQSVADQVAVALENARLFEQTVRRAEREKKALEITNKIRSTNDPKEMLRIAAEELQGALKASRAQIIMEPPEASKPASGNGNGSGNHKTHGNAR
ncbi:MAG TPA: GAF domain-containing protein [Longilinea sp.]|nr:GAF domain-containing protein [Longilinea sp.]